MDDENSSKKFIIFGRDVSQIPCYRDSFIWGIGGGFAGGLTYFLFTSNIRKANNVAVGSFMATTMAYWIKCRYQYFKEKHDLIKLKTALERNSMYEGTLIEKEVDENKKFDLKSA